MAKLNQIVALVNGKKTQTKNQITKLYQILQKEDLFAGLTRRYEPNTDDGEQFPTETTMVKFKVEDVLTEAKENLSQILDIVATQDTNNCEAKADLVVDDQVVVPDLPVTYLMFLEKQLVDLKTFVGAIPQLDPSFEWKYDENRNQFVTEPVETNKTKKVTHFKSVAEATEHHPEQIAQVQEDITIGKYLTTKFSGAMPARDKKEILGRLDKLQDAVKLAREEANLKEVQDKKVAQPILEFVFGAKS